MSGSNDMADRLSTDFRRTSQPAPAPVKAGLLRRFNPYDFEDAQVLAQATGRAELVRQILKTIRANAGRPEPPNQHVLVLGPRGMGKSFLVRWVQAALQAEQRAAGATGGLPVRFVRLSEEQLNVSAPELLLDEIRRVLEDRPADTVRVRWRAGGEPEWREALDALRQSIAALPGFADGRGLVVVSLENFDQLLEEVFADAAAQSRLRAMLAGEPRLMLLATATRPPDDAADKRLFQAFDRLPLAPWEPPDFVAFYRRAFRGGLEITPAVEAKILALAHFLGGSPRLAVLMGDILHSNDALSAVQTLDQLVDELTPYYQDRILNRLKPKPRWLLDEMLRGGEPCSQSDLAERVGARSQPEIAQPFQALLRDQVVTGARASGGRMGLYRVADRVFAHFYRKRYLAEQAHSPLAGMVDFLESFYSQQELLAQIERFAAHGELDKAEVLARALRQGADWHGVTEASRRRDCRRSLAEVAGLLAGRTDGAVEAGLEALTRLVQQRKTPEALTVAAALHDDAATPSAKVAVLLARGLVYTTLPDHPKATALLEAAVAEAARCGNAALHALSLRLLGTAEAYAGAAADAERHLEQAIETARAAGDEPGLARAMADRLWLFALTERWSDFDAAFAELDDAVDAERFPDILAKANSSRCYCVWRRGDKEAALAAAERAVALARQAGDATLALVAGNLSASHALLGQHEAALAAAQEQQRAAHAADELSLELEGMRRELFALRDLKRPAELLERAAKALDLAKTLDDTERQGWIHWAVADAHRALDHPDKALNALWHAVELSTRSKDRDLVGGTRAALLNALATDPAAHVDELFDAYLAWLQLAPPEAPCDDEPGGWPYTYAPRWHFDAFAAAATRAERWPAAAAALGAWARQHPGALAVLPAASAAVGDTVAAIFAERGAGPAFGAAAGFLRTVGDAWTAAEPSPALMDFLRELALSACSRFIARLEDPGLLRDLAREVRTQLEDGDIAAGLDAAALYREQGGDPRALETVDPDIREAVATLLGLYAAEPASGERGRGPGHFEGRVPGYRRADDLVSAAERERIGERLRGAAPDWPMPPLYAADWLATPPAEALDALVALIGAGRRAQRPNGLSEPGQFLDLLQDRERFGPVATAALGDARALRHTEPAFYPGWRLVEALVPRPRGELGDDDTAVIAALIGPDSVVPLLGTSPPIHALNASAAPRLDTAEQAAAYLRFFMSMLQAKDGPFRPIEMPAQLLTSRPLSQDEQATLEAAARPIAMEQGPAGDWKTRALEQYASGLFLAELVVKPSGAVEMPGDEKVAELDCIRRRHMLGGLRWLDGCYPMGRPPPDEGEAGHRDASEETRAD
jgi:tetratricopeptide (TPR) repeat protein